MNLQEIRQYVRNLLGEGHETEGFFTDEALNTYINAAYRDILLTAPSSFLNRARKTYTTTTDIGKVNYDLPDDYLYSVFVKYNTLPAEVREDSHENIAATALNSWFEGTPYMPVIQIQGDTMKLSPVPTQDNITIELHYIAFSPLEGDLQTPLVDETLHYVIGEIAYVRALEQDKEPEMAAYVKQTIVENMKKIGGKDDFTRGN